MASHRTEAAAVHYTSGPVFHALELPDDDDLVARSDFVARIETIIRRRGLTQVQAAALVAMDQPKASALPQTRPDLFSIIRLTCALRDLGQDVTITASRRPNATPTAASPPLTRLEDDCVHS